MSEPLLGKVIFVTGASGGIGTAISRCLARAGTPDDLADAVLAAATILRFTKGAISPIDGGRTLV